ncbi:Protein transport protein Sec31B [Heterocephalus glaber]|uniref:Protein transport protein Sec31B n=1 Tax=Heterocephalus glaber TaxID=10181 RepID=G5CAE1_HETGA|nr:Protein transport protein Sec31B [Heterocephalus glaber]
MASSGDTEEDLEPPPAKRTRRAKITFPEKIPSKPSLSSVCPRDVLADSGNRLHGEGQEEREETEKPPENLAQDSGLEDLYSGFRCTGCGQVFPNMWMLKKHLEDGVEGGASCLSLPFAKLRNRMKQSKRITEGENGNMTTSWAKSHVCFLPPMGQTMKLEELERPAVQMWSLASQYPVCLATGTSAQQLDASFSTKGTLEIYEIDFRDPSLDLKHKGVLSASSRFHKLIWGSFGSGLLESSGVIAGSGDNGMLTLYNVTHILSSGKEPVIAQKQKHTGPVRALDFNPFQALHFTLGRQQGTLLEPEVQHALPSAHPSSLAVVWDLRKNEPVIKVSDHRSRMHCSGLAWHPDIATQLMLCSEDDRLPVLQLWDLCFASSPLKVLDNHSRGILSVSWNQADAELLLSSAEDNQILCWNLRSSELGGTGYFWPSQHCCPAHAAALPCPAFVSQVTTESEFLKRAAELQEALGSRNLLNYCQNKSQQASLPSEKMLWKFLKVTLEQDSRVKFLKLLGYDKDELQKKVAGQLKSDLGSVERPQPQGDDLSSSRRQAFCSQVCSQSSTSAGGFNPSLSRNKNTDGILSQALLLGELGPAVELCLKEQRFVDAVILAQVGGTDLLKRTQESYFAKRRTKISLLLACVVQKNWKELVCTCSLKNWRQALALLLTYSEPEKFPELCDIRGTRVEQEGGRALTPEARLCYVCSGNVEQLVEGWARCHQASNPMALRGLMEKVMVLHRSLALQGSARVSPGPTTTYRITQYANFLASQGSLATAMNVLPVTMLRDIIVQIEIPGFSPGPQDSWKDSPAPRGNFRRKKLQQLPPKKVERKELPPEHQSLKTSFEGLLQHCSLSATDFKTRRKLDEAAQCLEGLHEKLCEGTVSSFMPVLKAVLSIAHKLQGWARQPFARGHFCCHLPPADRVYFPTPYPAAQYMRL